MSGGGNLANLIVLSDDVTLHVFQEILKNRSAVFKDLVGAAARKAIGKPTQDDIQVEAAVSRLKDASLIMERSAPIKDFNSYYVTSAGLNAERQLQLTNIGSAAG